ncbi:diguanylate cyclase [Babesia caballi]|uniref:Diguanylate cyclase n=1 Tax=Babesia caballi TaxID=5871 RepID=A0AAV4LVX1_BABCB|nr:diguanylate cyclase [Babesia caballi]
MDDNAVLGGLAALLLLHLAHDGGDEGVPVVQTNLEGLLVVDVGDFDQSLEQEDQGLTVVGVALDDALAEVLQEVGAANAELGVEGLPEKPHAGRNVLGVVVVHRSQGEHGHLGHELRPHGGHPRREGLHLLGGEREAGDLSQTLGALDSVNHRVPEVVEQKVDENDAERSPDSLGVADGAVQHKEADVKNLPEVRGHARGQPLHGAALHMVLAKVKQLLAEHVEQPHVVLAEALRHLRGAADLGDEALPAVRPLALHDLNQRLVQLGQEVALAVARLIVHAYVDHQLRNVAADAEAVVRRQHVPPRLDAALQHLEREEFGVYVARVSQNHRDVLPALWEVAELLQDLVRHLAVLPTARVEHGVDHGVQQRDRRLIEHPRGVEQNVRVTHGVSPFVRYCGATDPDGREPSRLVPCGFEVVPVHWQRCCAFLTQ